MQIGHSRCDARAIRRQRNRAEESGFTDAPDHLSPAIEPGELGILPGNGSVNENSVVRYREESLPSRVIEAHVFGDSYRIADQFESVEVEGSCKKRGIAHVEQASRVGAVWRDILGSDDRGNPLGVLLFRRQIDGSRQYEEFIGFVGDNPHVKETFAIRRESGIPVNLIRSRHGGGDGNGFAAGGRNLHHPLRCAEDDHVRSAPGAPAQRYLRQPGDSNRRAAVRVDSHQSVGSILIGNEPAVGRPEQKGRIVNRRVRKHAGLE